MDGSYLITGAAGFIGSSVASVLIERGAHVVGLDNFDPYYDVALKRANVAACQSLAEDGGSEGGGGGGGGGGSFSFEVCDIRDANAMGRLFDRVKPECVIHLAARAGVRPSLVDPVGYYETNVLGTGVVLGCCEAVGVKSAVVASSSSVYGNNKKVPFAESDRVDEPISPYAASKKATELVCHAHHHLTGMPVGCLRFFTVYGPRQRPDLAIGMFLDRVSRGEVIPVFGDGSSSRDYTYIDDIVSGVLAGADRIDEFGYRVWNLGGSSPVTLSEMIETIGRVVGVEPRIDRQPMQPGDVDRTYADVSLSRAELGFLQKVEFERGVQLQWDWMRANSVEPKAAP